MMMEHCGVQSYGEVCLRKLGSILLQKFPSRNRSDCYGHTSTAVFFFLAYLFFREFSFIIP